MKIIKEKRGRRGVAAILAAVALGACGTSVRIASGARKDVDWPAFSGHMTGDHYSTLS
jgi:hypothetical protein